MAKYTLEIDTPDEPADMIRWALEATEKLDEDASWSLLKDGAILVALTFELREP